MRGVTAGNPAAALSSGDSLEVVEVALRGGNDGGKRGPSFKP